MLPFARAALSAVASARQAVEDLSGLVRGHVSVGMVTACPVELMPAAVAGFHRQYADVEISLVEDNSDGLLAGVAAGRIDLALAGLADDPPAGIAVQVIADEPLHAAVAPGHELASRSSVPVRALAKCDLIALPRGTGGRTALEAACARAGVAPRIVIEASDPRVLAAMAQRGLGVAVLPDSGWEDLILVPIVPRVALPPRPRLARRRPGLARRPRPHRLRPRGPGERLGVDDRGRDARLPVRGGEGRDVADVLERGRAAGHGLPAATPQPPEA